MAKQASSRDDYMNFVGTKVMLGADTSVVVKGEIDTSLSVRGGLAWLIHLVEWVMGYWTSPGQLLKRAVLSTRNNLTSYPALYDDGVIDQCIRDTSYEAGGHATDLWMPKRHGYLPPIPIASSKLALYAHTVAHNAASVGEVIECRIGFTTIKLGAAAYTEVAETWSQKA